MIDLENNNSILAIIPDDWYQRIIVSLLRDLEKRKVCYTTLNKRFDELLDFFELNMIEKTNFTFLEGIIFVKDKDPDDEFMDFLSNAYDLSSLTGACAKMVQVNKTEVLLIDSLSTLMLQNENEDILRFITDTIDAVEKLKTKVIFIVLASDTKTDLISKMGLVVDKIVSLD